MPIYGWNILFPLVLIGWVTKKGRNWLKSPQIDYLLDYRTAAQRDSELFITTMITDLIGRHEVLSPIYHKKLKFPRKEVQSSYERKGKFAFNRLILTSLLCSKLLPLFMGKNSPFWRKLVHCCCGDWNQGFDWLNGLNYNFECDRLINLSDNKLSDNNLAIELVENRSFFNQSQAKKWYICFLLCSESFSEN